MASGMQKLVNKVKSGAREFADSLTPTLKVRLRLLGLYKPWFLY